MTERWRVFFQSYGKLVLVCFIIAVGVYASVAIISNSTLHPLRVSFLDIGQGDSILIQTPSGHTMIIDGGPNDTVLERLHDEMNYFDRNIDVLVATHPDADHVTGLVPVLEKYNVRDVVISGAKSTTGVFADLDHHVEDEHAIVHVANEGDVIDFHDGVIATILHPHVGERFKDTNSASVSILLTYGNETALFTGDLPTANEAMLISSGLLPHHVTIYKAGHHGSKYSSGTGLLTYIKPEYAIISAGKNNKYGHPNPEATERLTRFSKEIISTIDHGTITFETDGSNMNILTTK